MAIDGAKIVHAVMEGSHIRDAKGIIPLFGVYLSLFFVQYYNKLSFDFERMMGEDQASKSEELLIEAGLTGIKACSTLQSSDAIKSIFRLQNLGVNNNELSLVLRGVVAQRIVRKVCSHCVEKYRPNKEILEMVGLLNLLKDLFLAHGNGCKECLGSGYLDRIPIFETLLINDKISSLIYKGSPYGEIKSLAERLGFAPMRIDGVRKVLAGITTIEEVIRVT